LGNPILLGLLIEIDFFNLKSHQFKIPNSKLQIPNKFQIRISNDQNTPHLLPLPPGERGRVRGL
jgi:hypothetical protein